MLSAESVPTAPAVRYVCSYETPTDVGEGQGNPAVVVTSEEDAPVYISTLDNELHRQYYQQESQRISTAFHSVQDKSGWRYILQNIPTFFNQTYVVLPAGVKLTRELPQACGGYPSEEGADPGKNVSKPAANDAKECMKNN